MDWGMDEDVPAIAEALQSAKDQNIIILAAAGPEDRPIQFPARRNDFVFCIASADAMGTPVPRSYTDSSISEMYTCLGEGVRGAERNSNDYVRNSGSSVAVMVASGFVAILLD